MMSLPYISNPITVSYEMCDHNGHMNVNYYYKMAMSLSAACVIHCLFAPTLIIFAYSFLSFSVESELIHYIILTLALPISALALTLGYRNHKVLSFLIVGIFGLSFMLLAVLLGEGTSEKVLTVIGSSIVAYAHF